MDLVTQVQVLGSDDRCPQLSIVESAGVARAVVWPGVGATRRSMHRITLGAGSRTVRLKHPMEAVYYVMSGTARVLDGENGFEHAAVAGSMIFVEPETPYVIAGDGDGVEVVGGPCPPDPALYQEPVGS